jgi:hypothetical protein
VLKRILPHHRTTSDALNYVGKSPRSPLTRDEIVSKFLTMNDNGNGRKTYTHELLDKLSHAQIYAVTTGELAKTGALVKQNSGGASQDKAWRKWLELLELRESGKKV